MIAPLIRIFRAIVTLWPISHTCRQTNNNFLREAWNTSYLWNQIQSQQDAARRVPVFSLRERERERERERNCSQLTETYKQFELWSLRQGQPHFEQHVRTCLSEHNGQKSTCWDCQATRTFVSVLCAQTSRAGLALRAKVLVMSWITSGVHCTAAMWTKSLSISRMLTLPSVLSSV